MAILGQRPGVIPADGKEGGERVCVWGEDTTKQESLMLSQRVTLNWAREMAQPRVLKPGILSAILGTYVWWEERPDPCKLSSVLLTCTPQYIF